MYKRSHHNHPLFWAKNVCYLLIYESIKNIGGALLVKLHLKAGIGILQI